MDYRADYLVVIVVLVYIIGNVQQLVDDIPQLLGNALAYARARILRGNSLANENEPVYREPLPFVAPRAALADALDLAVGIINKCGKTFALRG